MHYLDVVGYAVDNVGYVVVSGYMVVRDVNKSKCL